MDPSEIKLWLKGRDKNNLRICSNAYVRKIGIVDISKADWVSINISEFRGEKSLLKTYKYVHNRCKETNDGAMLQTWLDDIVSPSL